MRKNISVRRFEDFIINSSSAHTSDDLFSHFITALGQLGFDKCILTIINDKDIAPEGYAMGVHHNWSESWVQEYIDKKWDIIDPIKRHIGFTSEAFKWDDLAGTVQLSDKQTHLLCSIKEMGLRNGIAIPLRGTGSKISAIGIASSEEIDACDPHIDLITAYCQQFFLCYKRFFTHETISVESYESILSPKEREILTWVANGKTDEDIASIMNISRHTVDSHMRHIFQKLDVTSRIQAVVKGLMYGLITP